MVSENHTGVDIPAPSESLFGVAMPEECHTGNDAPAPSESRASQDEDLLQHSEASTHDFLTPSSVEPLYSCADSCAGGTRTLVSLTTPFTDSAMTPFTPLSPASGFRVPQGPYALCARPKSCPTGA